MEGERELIRFISHLYIISVRISLWSLSFTEVEERGRI
jgi:hypothetical protein